MLVIRLQKVGKIHTATFRVVVTEKTAGPRRQYLELVGTLDRKTKKLNLNKERILYWISKGAQPSDTVHNLLVAQGIIIGSKIAVHKVSERQETHSTSSGQTSDKKQETIEIAVPVPAAAPAEAPAA